MRIFRQFLVLAAIAAASIFASTASAQIEGEDEASVNKAFAAIMAAMPRDGDLIKVPYASMYGSFGAESAEMIDDPDVPGHKAYRVVAKKGRNNWDTSVTSAIGPAIKKGDLLVMVFYAKLVEGSPELPYNSIGLTSPPFSPVIGGGVTVTDEWDVYIVQGKADKDYKQNSVGMSFHMGNASHTVDFGPVFVLNLGS